MTDTAPITESAVNFDGVALNALAMLQNRHTGLGQRGRDKYLDHEIATDFTPLTRSQLQACYRKSPECQKVVDLLPKAATAENWIEVTIGKGRKGIPAKAVQYSEDLKLRGAVCEAGIMGRLDGDGFVIVGVDDGGEPWEPVNEGRIRKISWVYPVDRWRIYPETTTGRPGHPELYSLYQSVTDTLPGQAVSGKIHRSRVLRFPGKKLWGDMITYNSGYNDSALQTFFPAFVPYLIAIEYSTRMVQDYNVFTYKLQGLTQLILAGDQEAIFHRFQTILLSMSTLGGLAMDADREDAQFINRNFSGLDALIDRLKDRASGASGLPPTQIWGSSQKSALSNSSEGDKYAWADCVADYRSETLSEPIHDFFRLLLLAQNGPTGGRLPESWGVKYKSALRLNLKEQTALRKDQTTGVDVPSITAGILLKEEVRESAWGGDGYTIERQLQPDLWAKQQAEQEEPEPEPDEGEGEEEDPGANDRTDDGDRLDAWHEDAMFYEWHEDAGGVPCGKGWIRAGHKCSKGISASHPAHNPNHATHAALQGALAAANGNHAHAAANPDHPDHAAYKAGFGVHGGKGEIKPPQPPAAKSKPKAGAKPASSGKAKAKAAALKAKTPSAKSDKETLEANGHGSFEVKSRLAELAKLNPSDAGDKAYKNALLHPIDPDGSTESSLDRTQDQRRLREKKSLDADQIRDAGANLRQGMRGIAGGENNRAVLEYSAQIYDRLNDSQKTAFAAEAGKTVYDDPLYKVPRYGKLIADIKARHGKANADADDGGSESPNPKEPTGGTNRTDADNPILSLIDRADKHLQGLEASAIERVNSALESSYKDLEAQILRSYSQETPGSLMGRDRALVLLSQVADLLQLLNTRNADDIQQAFEDLLRGADAQGTTLADDLARAIANQALQMTANVPVAAIVNQATEGMTRLRNHTEAFAEKASTIVSQGLIQGFGTDKIASLLRQELGVVQHKARAIARTESLSASNRATEQTYQANNIQHVQLISTVDDRTCPYCCARTMNVYELGKIAVPLHVCCRCYLLPWSRTWQQLGLTNDAWAAKFKAGVLAALTAQGLEPNHGLAPFEKANGLDAPEPVWAPGERSDGFECDEWREDAGIPCGKGWTKAGNKCKSGIAANHAAANPHHAGHAAYQGALAAASGNHTHATAHPNHPDHAAYKAGFDSHGGTAPLPSAAGGAASGAGAVGGGDTSSTAPATPATPAKKTTKPAAAKTTKKPATKKQAVQAKPAPGATHPDFEPLHAMANGTKPDAIKLTTAQTKAAELFMGSGYAGSAKQIQIQKEGKTSAAQSQALAHWLGHSYTKMSKRIWNHKAGEDPHGGILAADILATQALHKLPSVTAAQVEEGAKAKGHFDFDAAQPLNRWMRIPKEHVKAFVKKYQDAEGGEIHEDNFFGTSHLAANQMGGFSMGANVIYKVTAKMDGTGQGKYVDHFKKTMNEGEVLFPPYSKFKVVKVTAPKPQKQASLTATEKDAIAFHTKYAKKLGTAQMNADIFGEDLAKGIKKAFGKAPVPGDWEAKLALGESVKAKQTKPGSQPYIIELHEI